MRTVAGNGNFDDFNYNNVVALKTSITPTSMCIDSSGDLYFTIFNFPDGFAKLTMSTGIMTTRLTEVIYPRYLTIDGFNNIYYGAYNSAIIRKITVSDGLTTTVASVAVTGGLYVDASGYIYVADSTRHVVAKVTPGSMITAPPTSPPTAPPTGPPTAPPTSPPTVPPIGPSTMATAPSTHMPVQCPSRTPTRCPTKRPVRPICPKPSRAPYVRPPF